MQKSVDGTLEELARRQHGAVSRAQALASGASTSLIDRRVAAGRWMRTASGVYVLAGWPRTYRQRAMIATLAAGDGAFASHRCAAMLRALDGVGRAPVEVTVPRRLRGTAAGAVMHYSSDATRFDWSLVDGIPTASVTRIIVDLAGDPLVELDVLERIFECGQRRGETSHDAVREMFERLARSGKPGVRRGRELVARLVDDGTVNHSELETRFYQLLRNAGLPLPKRQRLVNRPDGRFAFADYGYEGDDGVIELLGHRWHSSRDALTSDAERNNDLVLDERRIVMFTWDHVTRTPAYVIATMKRFLRAIRVEYRGENAQE